MEQERRIQESHWKDLARVADRAGKIMYTDFLSLEEQSDLLATVRLPGLKVDFFGGYEEAERKMASFCPLFLSVSDVPKSYPLVCLEITLKDGHYLQSQPQHRDYLGSVLGQGIDRRMIGDILLQKEGAFLFVAEDMAGYLISSLETVGRAHVKVNYHEGEVQALNDGKEQVISLASLRLDAVIARGFGMGREDSSSLIRSGHVQLNHLLSTKIDASVQAGDVISARGNGRIIVLEEKGTSKSGRLQVLIKRFS